MPISTVSYAPQHEFDSFLQFLNEAAGYYLYSVHGLSSFRETLLPHLAGGPFNPGRRIFLSLDDDDDFAYTNSLATEAPWSLSESGPTARFLGLQWIVYVYSVWEGRFRKAIARAANAKKDDDVECDVMGDLRWVRNDIVHNRAIATKNEAAKCKVLWSFSEGDPITVDWQDIRRFLSGFGVRQRMQGTPSSFTATPEFTIRINE